MKYILVGISGIIFGIVGIIYNLNYYFEYKNERDILINSNSISKVVKKYNDNIIKINDLSTKANKHVVYGICFCVFGGISSIIMNQGRRK